jgi:hypothetical protein
LTLGNLLRGLSEAELELSATEGEDVLRVRPASNLTPELSMAIREHKGDLMRVALEDQRFRETGVLQSERQVFELAHEHFGVNEKGGAAQWEK